MNLRMFPTERLIVLRIPMKKITTTIVLKICKMYPAVESYLWWIWAISSADTDTQIPMMLMIATETPASK